MLLNKFEYNNCTYILQSYLKSDFANISEINGNSFRIDFINKSISTTAKENKEWIAKAESININEIMQILDLLQKNIKLF